MYYTSNLSWKKIRNKITPKYLIKKCISRDGLNWKLNVSKVIDFKSKEEIAITRPWIINYKNKRIMFFSCKKKYYKIHMALENKHKNWERVSDVTFSNKSYNNFDNKSPEREKI